MKFDLDGVLLVVIWTAAVAVIITSWLAFSQWRRTRKIKAQVADDKRSKQSLKEASSEYSEAKTKLNERSGSPLILEVVNDITTDPAAGGARPYVDLDTAVRVLEAVKSAPDDQAIDIVLHTLGGWSSAGELIANALKNHKGTTRAYVPYLAKSAGTMIALACKEIHLGKNAALGPIDSQMDGASFSSYERLLKSKPVASIADDTLLTAYEFEKYQAKEFSNACELLHDEHKKKDGEKTCSVVYELAGKNRPHGERIGFKVAKEIGINVKDGCPADVYKLVNARLQMIRRHNQQT